MNRFLLQIWYNTGKRVKLRLHYSFFCNAAMQFSWKTLWENPKNIAAMLQQNRSDLFCCSMSAISITTKSVFLSDLLFFFCSIVKKYVFECFDSLFEITSGKKKKLMSNRLFLTNFLLLAIICKIKQFMIYVATLFYTPRGCNATIALQDCRK